MSEYQSIPPNGTYHDDLHDGHHDDHRNGGHGDCQGTHATTITVVRRDRWEEVNAEVINERMVSLFVNGIELATLMCTPCNLTALALGFLANEGVIASYDEVRAVHECPSGACIDVWLNRTDFEPPRRMVLTSGCGGGITFDDLSQVHPPVQSDLCVAPERLWELMDELYARAELYSRSRGVHTSIFSDGQRVLAVAEDVGRHNTLDKLRGITLVEGIPTSGGLLMTTGRVSSEMLNKARSMDIPLVCSRTSATSLSTQLAQEWQMTLVGYLRRNSMKVYTHPERVLCSAASPNGNEQKGNVIPHV